MNDNIRTDADDDVQHGIDDNPNNDAEKGATLGGLGGVAVGAAAGSMAGPVGTAVGAVVGAAVGAVASGAAVGAVDSVDNDDTVTGIGDGQTRDVGDQMADASDTNTQTVYTTETTTETFGNDVPGIQTGGVTAGGAPDTRGLTEKAADAVTGDDLDDKTGRRVI
jgi:hypothetical protein